VFVKAFTLADIQNKLTFKDWNVFIRFDNGVEVQLTGFDPNAADTGPHAVDTYLFAVGNGAQLRGTRTEHLQLPSDENDNLITGTN
jgi:hypothetical protein